MKRISAGTFTAGTGHSGDDSRFVWLELHKMARFNVGQRRVCRCADVETCMEMGVLDWWLLPIGDGEGALED